MKRLYVPIFGNWVYLFNDEDEAKRFVSKHGGDPEELSDVWGVSHIFKDKGDEWKRMICVFDGSLSTTVHECLHAAWDTLNNKQVKVSVDNDEMLSYLTAWLVTEFVRAFPPTCTDRDDPRPKAPAQIKEDAA